MQKRSTRSRVGAPGAAKCPSSTGSTRVRRQPMSWKVKSRSLQRAVGVAARRPKLKPGTLSSSPMA
ncbi:unnamed protein product [Effrenium voratum]|uniref:Uncharacterized protein n=1 Tax=Effrenium voratum TaxID=2562239 RepID=A0AA36JBL3_9DINO|nr:unnamed protein product [Effrenium voratum]CAJ1402285.1 unnamed protein product [Effrenium voratum]